MESNVIWICAGCEKQRDLPNKVATPHMGPHSTVVLKCLRCGKTNASRRVRVTIGDGA